MTFLARGHIIFKIFWTYLWQSWIWAGFAKVWQDMAQLVHNRVIKGQVKLCNVRTKKSYDYMLPSYVWPNVAKLYPYMTKSRKSLPRYSYIWPSYANLWPALAKLWKIVTTPTQLKVGFDTKMTLDHHHPPPPQTQCHQYLSCSWPDFNQTLKVGLCDQ